jgi:hypothetical protein
LSAAMIRGDQWSENRSSFSPRSMTLIGEVSDPRRGPPEVF